MQDEADQRVQERSKYDPQLPLLALEAETTISFDRSNMPADHDKTVNQPPPTNAVSTQPIPDGYSEADKVPATNAAKKPKPVTLADPEA